MGGSLDRNRSKEPKETLGKTIGADTADQEQPPAGLTTPEVAAVRARAERRKRLFQQDERGRTPLFYAAEQGDLGRVKEIIYSFRGTGLGPPRLALITRQDNAGLTAADVAEQNGHEEIVRLLRSEQGRMEFFE